MKPNLNEFYRHRYGGVYVVSDVATHTTTDEQLVIYSHVYPFEESVFARPLDEWTHDRFKQISYDEVQMLLDRDRAEFQLEITEAKKAAKAEKV